MRPFFQFSKCCELRRLVYKSMPFGNVQNFLKLAGGLSEKFLAMGHFCKIFKKVIFFEFLIKFRNF